MSTIYPWQYAREIQGRYEGEMFSPWKGGARRQKRERSHRVTRCGAKILLPAEIFSPIQHINKPNFNPRGPPTPIPPPPSPRSLLPPCFLLLPVSSPPPHREMNIHVEDNPILYPASPPTCSPPGEPLLASSSSLPGPRELLSLTPPRLTPLSLSSPSPPLSSPRPPAPTRTPRTPPTPHDQPAPRRRHL